MSVGKFQRGDPESTASAIHLRKLSLIPPEEADPVTFFECEVYKYFDIFKQRHVKSTTEHKFIPKANELMRMSEIHRIIQRPETQDEQNDVILNTLLY